MRIANGTMLTIARESRRLTQSTFARQIGVAQGTISKVESGALAVDETMLARYARALGYPAALLVQPQRMIELPEAALEKLESVSALERRALRAQWNLLQLRARHAWWRRPSLRWRPATARGRRCGCAPAGRWPRRRSGI